MASNRNKTKYSGVFYRLVQSRIKKGKQEKVYYVYFKKNGKVFEERVGKEWEDKMTPASASRILADRISGKRKSPKEIRAEAAAQKIAEQGRWTVDKLWEAYAEHRDKTRSFESDLSRYRKYIKDPFGDKELKNLVPLDFDRLRINLLKVKSPQTVKHVLGIIKRLHHFAIKKNLAPGLSFAIEMPKVDNQKTEDLTPGQLSALIKAIEQSEHTIPAAMMKTALYTGMRRGEMFKLQWDDIDFERGFIFLREPKGGASQKIPLNDSARNIFNALPRSSKFVFPGRGGRLRTTCTREVNTIKKDAGLPKDFRPLHGLRHTYASMLASSGQVDMYTLQKLLTHKSPQMTQRYAHLRDETLKKASGLAGDLMNQAISEKAKEVGI